MKKDGERQMYDFTHCGYKNQNTYTQQIGGYQMGRAGKGGKNG